MFAAAAKTPWQSLRIVFISGRPDLFNGTQTAPVNAFSQNRSLERSCCESSVS